MLTTLIYLATGLLVAWLVKSTRSSRRARRSRGGPLPTRPSAEETKDFLLGRDPYDPKHPKHRRNRGV